MIKLLLLDIDGVMTDGKVFIDENGNESKKIDFHDVDAIFRAKRAGLKIGFISGEDGSIVEYFEHRFDPDVFVKACKNKKSAVERIITEMNIDPNELAYVGDSRHDHEVIKLVGLGMCPTNATSDTKELADHILTRRGGDGAVREAIMLIEQYNCRVSKDIVFERETLLDYYAKIDEILHQHNQMIQIVLRDQELKSRLAEIANIIVETLRTGNQIFFCGNGGSASDAQHLATEFVSRFYHERKALSAEALTTNTSSLTAIANDYSFNQVFSRQVEARGKPGDILVGLTTSGNSGNVVKALQIAREKAMTTIAMTGNHDCTEVEKVSHITVKIPSRLTPRIQEGHILVGHLICELVEKEFI